MEVHRSGEGPPLVLLHGFTGTWRAWNPVLGGLAAHHTIFAPTLAGHSGAAPLEPDFPGTVVSLVDALERQLDAEGLDQAHLVGNSLGGWVALELGRRGRALSVVALSPAGGWSRPRDLKRVVAMMRGGRVALERLGPRLTPMLGRPGIRKLLLKSVAEHGDRIPPAEVQELLTEALGCLVFDQLLTDISGSSGLSAGEASGYPIRIAWSEKDRTIPLERYGRPLLANVPGAELVILPGVGHVPMFDDPALVTRTILDVTTAAVPHTGATA